MILNVAVHLILPLCFQVIELYNGLISLRHLIRFVYTAQIWIAFDHDHLVVKNHCI